MDLCEQIVGTEMILILFANGFKGLELNKIRLSEFYSRKALKISDVKVCSAVEVEVEEKIDFL